MDLPQFRITRLSLLILIATIPFMMFWLAIKSKEHAVHIRAREMVARWDRHAIEPEWDPHRLGICILATDSARLHDALEHARRVFPTSPIHVVARYRPREEQLISRRFSTTTTTFVDRFTLDDVVDCMRAAANHTQIVALLDDMTWTYSSPPVIPDGLVGLVGKHEILVNPACASHPHIHDSLIVEFGSVFLSYWVSRQVTNELVAMTNAYPDAMSHLVRCTGERMGADARVSRLESEMREEDDPPAFLYRDSLLL